MDYLPVAYPMDRTRCKVCLCLVTWLPIAKKRMPPYGWTQGNPLERPRLDESFGFASHDRRSCTRSSKEDT